MPRWPHRSRARSTGVRVLVLAALWALPGCREENFVAPVERPPLLVRTSIPGPEVEFFYDDEGLPLSMTFRRDILDGDIATVMLVPPPVSAGPQIIGLNSPREWIWLDVVLDPRVNSYRWLIDGPAMVEPVYLRFHPSAPRQNVGRVWGEVRVRGFETSPASVVVYALAMSVSATYDRPPDELMGLPIESIYVVHLGEETDEPGAFVLGDLVVQRRYLVVAILDSDGDGRYEPGQDWLGYPISSLMVPAVSVARLPLDAEAVPIHVDVLAPGILDPDPFR